ncbi:MAG: spore protease YyaC [Clostridia bacterium]|nr:spore protease YyaC [Clostridia bacterium]
MNDNNFKEYVDCLNKYVEKDKNIIFFCIGTDRVIGDCVGPITGSLLKNKYGNKNIYGDLEENLTYENIEDKLNEVNLKYSNPYIIAIDAALSSNEDIGKFYVDNKGINYRKSLNSKNLKIGDIGIKVVVGKDYNDSELNFKVLQNISLSKIVKISKKTFDGINILLNK